MKKLLLTLLLLCLTLTACGQKTVTLEIRIPAGSAAGFYCADEELSPRSDSFTVSVQEPLSIMLEPMNDTLTGFLPQSIATSAQVHAVQGQWFRIGVVTDSPSDTDRILTIRVKGVTLRIP